MAQYIDKSALVAEIKKIYNEDYKFLPSDIAENIQDFKDYVLRNIDTLEVKEVDDELQGIEKEVAEDRVNAIDRKRIPIVLKGEIKAKFKNEFNTLWQTVDGIQFANVAKHIIERLCLHFAAWGVYNLKGYCSISSEEKHKMDIEVKEVDLEKEVKRWKNEHGVYGMDDLDFIFAKHFFELGLKTKDQ